MRIGYDAKRLFHNDTGLGFYSRTLVQSLQSADPSFKASLFDAYPSRSPLTLPFFDPQRFTVIPTGFPSWYFRSINPARYIRNSGIQLFHGLSGELPYVRLPAGLPAVVTIHDVLFKSFLEDFPWHDRWIYDWKTRTALDRADQIIAISETTKQELLKYYKINENKIRVIHQSYDPIFDVPVPAGEWIHVLNKLKLPREYLLYVGSVTPRKNLKVILEALNAMSSAKRIPLLVLGKGGFYQKSIKEYIRQNQLEKWIYFLPDLPRSEIRILYDGAQVLIYPSLGEGFGLPVLEGIAANVPVITSSVSALPEAGGKVASYFNPTDAEELKSLILSINKTQFNLHIRDKRTAHLEKFNRSGIAGLYLNEVYKNLI
jgi:glycosyltransferase involved in cell wall biosynthesis